MTEDLSDPRWDKVGELFDRAEARRREAKLKRYRGPGFAKRRAYLRDHAAELDQQAIRLREWITGESEA